MAKIRGAQKRPCSSAESTGSSPLDDHNEDKGKEVMSPANISGGNNKREKLLLGPKEGQSSRTQPEKRTFDCGDCGGKFDTPKDFLGQGDGARPYPDCDICGEKFKTRKDFVGHQKVHSPLILVQTQIQDQAQAQTQSRPLPPALPYIPPSALAAARPKASALRRPTVALAMLANGGSTYVPRLPMVGPFRPGNVGSNIPRQPMVGLAMRESVGPNISRGPMMGPSSSSGPPQEGPIRPTRLPREWAWFNDLTARLAAGGPVFAASTNNSRTTEESDNVDVELELKLRID